MGCRRAAPAAPCPGRVPAPVPANGALIDRVALVGRLTEALAGTDGRTSNVPGGNVPGGNVPAGNVPGSNAVGSGVAVFAIEFDRFKAVSDLFGHATGDQLLHCAMTRMMRCVRGQDPVARLRDDAFCIVQPGMGDVGTAMALARRLVGELSEPFVIDGQELCLSVDIGIAVAPQHGTTAETLLVNADTALSVTRQGGHNQSVKRGGGVCVFEAGMDTQVRSRRALAADLRRAIETGGLHLHYQPLCDSATLRICGYEALVRWNHPRLGRIEPSQFIPLAEESGMIHQLGRWVLEQACRAAATWPAHQYVAVNISPLQMRHGDLPAVVADILWESGLSPDRLELEITESVLIENIDRAASCLQAIRASGVRLALDDFGTGYSSLSYLRRLPFDRVKIDRSFVQGLGDDASADTIIRLIVGLGRDLGMHITAEGVETEAQLRVLQAHRCSHVQGFLIGRPVPDRGTGRGPAAEQAVAAELEVA